MVINLRTIESIAKYAEKAVAKETPIFGGLKSIMHTKPALLKGIKPSEVWLQPSEKSLPTYLYHMTTPENYSKMLASGSIKATKDQLFGDGVFMFEIKNLFKNWNNQSAWGGENLKFKLINHARKQGWDLVALRIPTDSIENKLKIRSQEQLFGHYKNVPRFVLDKHILQGAKVQYAEGFAKQGQSIEYIYPKDIDMSLVEKVGEVNIRDLQKMPDYDSFMPLKSFFRTIFKEQPEQQISESLLKC